MPDPTPATVSVAACRGCRYLLVYRCPCQAPRCRKGAAPNGAGCVRRRHVTDVAPQPDL